MERRFSSGLYQRRSDEQSRAIEFSSPTTGPVSFYRWTISGLMIFGDVYDPGSLVQISTLPFDPRRVPESGSLDDDV